jgi:hypothetical protein
VLFNKQARITEPETNRQRYGEKIMAIKINKVDNFPEIQRVGRTSEELQMLIDALHMSAKTGQKFSLEGIEPGNAYNSMQQRIRAQAKKFGYKIAIRFDSRTKQLFFKAYNGPVEKVSTKEISSIKSKNTASK